MALNYIEQSLIVVSTITGCVSIFAFTSLVGIPVGIGSSAVGLIICVITARIKTFEPIIKKKRKKHDKIVFLIKDKLNRLIHSHYEFVSVNNVLGEYDDIKEAIKNLKGSAVYQIFKLYIKQCYHVV